MRTAPRSTGPGCLLTSLEEKPALEDVGAKAYNLARLRRAGHCVPEAVVLTTAAFRRFLETNSLDGAIASLRSGLDAGNITGIRRASRSIRELVLEAAMPDDVRAPLEAWYDGSRDGRLVVRSSGVGEDGPGASFAGQLDSFLDIGDLDALRWAVQACWASYWSERALAYQLGRGARLQGMGVLVQLRVDARFAGVLFTRSPDPADSSSMLVEYCAGLGDVLVNGTVTPGRLSMSRESHRWTVHQDASLPTGVDATALLNDSCLGRLRRTALEIEELFGGPQDIEWALDPDGRLQILQARPITTLAGSSTSGRHVPAGMTVWSNANVDENFPEPISPLLYSIARLGYEHYFRNLAFAFGLSRRRIDVMEPAFPGLIGVHAGRMYYNLTTSTPYCASPRTESNWRPPSTNSSARRTTGPRIATSLPSDGYGVCWKVFRSSPTRVGSTRSSTDASRRSSAPSTTLRTVPGRWISSAKPRRTCWSCCGPS